MKKDKDKDKGKGKGLLKRFVRYYKPHRKLFIIDMCCALIISIFNLVYPYVTKEIINNYVPNKLLYMLIAFSIILLVIYIIKALLNFVLQYWGHLVGVRMQADMRSELFNHLQKMPFTSPARTARRNTRARSLKRATSIS